MSGASEPVGPGVWNKWRVARWTAALSLVLTPAVMMRIAEDWHWTAGSFVVAAIVIGGLLLLYELAERASGSRAYRAGAAMALVTVFLTVWSTIVRDDGNGMAFFEPVMAAMLGTFVASLRPAGMARTMLGVAIIQAVSGLAIVSAPAAAIGPEGPFRAVGAAAFFAVLWLTSAALFVVAARESARASDRTA